MKNILLALVILGLLIWGISYVSNMAPPVSSITDPSFTDNALLLKVDASKFKALSDNAENVLIDIRTPEEYKEGHLSDSLNIDYYATDFKTQLSKLPKDRTYLIYCRSGSRSATALSIMKGLGFKSVYELEGGINNWTTAKLPVCINC